MSQPCVPPCPRDKRQTSLQRCRINNRFFKESHIYSCLSLCGHVGSPNLPSDGCRCHTQKTGSAFWPCKYTGKPTAPEARQWSYFNDILPCTILAQTRTFSRNDNNNTDTLEHVAVKTNSWMQVGRMTSVPVKYRLIDQGAGGVTACVYSQVAVQTQNNLWPVSLFSLHHQSHSDTHVVLIKGHKSQHLFWTNLFLFRFCTKLLHIGTPHAMWGKCNMTM